MIRTRAQREARAKIERYVRVLGPIKCYHCGGSMIADVDEDGAGWACLLCPARRWWNVPDEGGFVHLRPSDMCRKLTDDQLTKVYARFTQGAKQLDIVREFHLNRQTIVHLKREWQSRQAQTEAFLRPRPATCTSALLP